MANYTHNYQLHQWAPEDKFLRTDFNEDLNKIDTALGDSATKTAALEAAVKKFGNCQMEHLTYRGTGTCGPDSPTTILFSGHPLFFIIVGASTFTFGSFLMERLLLDLSHNNSYTDAAWNKNTLSFYAGEAEWQMNSRSETYHVFAFYDVSNSI